MEDLLKEFWPVALFFVISIISYVRNDAKMKQGKETSQPHTLDENFPEVELVEPSLTNPADVVGSLRLSGKKRTNKESASAKMPANTAETSETSTSGRGVKVALKDRSDAKKAFIYSEILNRKY